MEWRTPEAAKETLVSLGSLRKSVAGLLALGENAAADQLAAACDRFAQLRPAQDAGMWAADSCEEILRLVAELRGRSAGSVGVVECLSSVCNDLGDISVDLGDLSAAVRFCDISRELTEELHAMSPQGLEYARNLTVACSKLGSLYRRQGEDAQALSCFERVLDVGEDVSTREPQNLELLRLLLAVSADAADLHLKLGGRAAALVFRKIGVGIAMELQAASPQSVSTNRDLAFAHLRLFEHLQTEDVHLAVAHVEACHGVLKGMREIGMTLDPASVHLLEKLEATLSS